MLSLSAIRRISRFVLDDERIMIALRDLAITHQTDLSAWIFVLTDEEIIFTHRRVGEARWPRCKVLRAGHPQVPLVDKPDIRVQNEGTVSFSLNR